MAYEDVDRASSKGAELKALKNVTDKQKQDAADLYREAKAKINGYLQNSITRASGYVVDEPSDNYAKTKAADQVTALTAKVNELRGTAIATIGGTEVAAIAMQAIEEIKKLNDQDQKPLMIDSSRLL